MLKIYNLVIALLLVSTLFAQNDNRLIPLDDSYYIQSAINYGKNNGGVWDLPGTKDFAIGQQLSVSAYTPEQNKKGYFVDNKTDADRKYKFIISNSEYLKIRLSTVNAFIDLVGNGSKNGTNIAISEGENSSSQNFRFVYLNNGRFKIYNENGKLLKLNSKTSANGTKVVLWDDWNGNNAQWFLISVKTKKALVLPNKQKITKRQKDWADMGGIGRFIIQSALNFGKNDGGCFDIPGNNHAKKGDNLQVWSLDEGTDRVYSVIEAKNKAYYNIVVGPARGTDLVVDVASNGYRDGTNIGVWKVNNKSSQNFYFKHLGDGRYRIFNENGKVIALNNGSSQNGSNIITWSNHSQKSAEWYLLDVDTRKAFIPYPVPSNLSGIKSGNMPGPESRALAANINDTYKEVNKTEQRIKALNQKAAGARKALERTKSASNGINDLNGRVNRTRESLTIFQKLPIIGTPVTTLAVSLDKIKGKLNKTNASVKKLEKSTLGPTLNSAYALNEAMYTLQRKLTDVNKKLLTTKIKYNKAASCVTKANDAALTSTFESNSKNANNDLNEINSSLTDINKSITELEKIIKSVNKLNGQLGPLEKQIKNINKAFKETDKVAKEIDKVLRKKFTKKIAGKKVVDISLKKALNVGKKYTKEVTNFINKWVGKAIDPIIKKLNIKIPGVNIDGLKKELANLKNSSKLLADKTKKVLNYNKRLDEIKNKLNNNFDACLNVPSCNIDANIDLMNLALVESDTEGARSDPTKPLPNKLDLKPNLNFTDGNYNNIFNLSTQSPLEVRTAKVGDEVDALFDQAGLTSANARAADVYTGIGFMNSPMQKFYVKHQGNGYYSIYNEYTKTALTVNDKGNVAPETFSGKDNQLFLIIRDVEKYRYAAFIISKQNGKALTIATNGSVIQKNINPTDKSQVWAFSNRKVWKNEAGFLGVKKLTIEKEFAVATNDSETAKWNYIVNPAYKNAYYIMNANSTLFLATNDEFDKNNLQNSYELVQNPYIIGLKVSMLYYMNYSDESKTKVNIIDVNSRYVVDVNSDSHNLELVKPDVASSYAAWSQFSTVKEAGKLKTSEKLTLKQETLVKLLKSMEILPIEEYLQNVSMLDFVTADNIGGDTNESLLAKTVNEFDIDDKVQLIVSMVRGASENKSGTASTAILDALAKIDFSQTNDVVEPFKDIAQQSIQDIANTIKNDTDKKLITKIIRNLD
jgi:predicted  nucleic acid-binding Zn-ribbon protein